MIYLEKLEMRTDVPADIKEVIPYEKGQTLIDGARREHSPEGQNRQLDLARGFLEQFLKASPNHPNAGKANTELANVIVGKGKVEVLLSKSPGNVAQKLEHQNQARAYFAEARQRFQAAHDRYKEAYDKFDKFIPKKKKRNTTPAKTHIGITSRRSSTWQCWSMKGADLRQRLA